MQAPWGKKALTNYLGPDTQSWRDYDASELVARRPFPGPILIDQGAADQFLAEQLQPEIFSAAAAKAGQSFSLHAFQATIMATTSFRPSWGILRHHAKSEMKGQNFALAPANTPRAG